MLLFTLNKVHIYFAWELVGFLNECIGMNGGLNTEVVTSVELSTFEPWTINVVTTIKASN